QSDSDKFAKSMKEQGGVPIICPLIETKLRRSPFELQTTSDDWLIFTSVNGVAFFLAQYKAFFIENTCKVAVIGEATKQAIENHGVQVDFMPKVFRAKNMMEEFFHKFNNVKRIIQVKG